MISFLRTFISRRRNMRKLGKKGLVGSRKRRTTDQTLSNAVEHSKILAISMLIAVWCVSVFILVFKKDEAQDVSLVLGQTAPNTIFSELNTFEYTDNAATTKLKELEIDKVALFFRVSNIRISQSIKLTNEFFAFLERHYKEIQKNKKWEVPEKKNLSEIIKKISPTGVSTLYQLIENPIERKNYIKLLNRALESGIMSRQDKNNLKLGQRIRVIDVKGRVRMPRLLVEMVTPKKAAVNIAGKVLEHYSSNDRNDFRKALVVATEMLIGKQGNMIFDKEYTETEQQKAAAGVKPVIIKYEKNKPLIRKGNTVTSKDLEILKQYSIQLKESTQKHELWERLLRIGVICMLLMVVTGIYIYHIHPEVAKSNQKIWVIGSTVIIGIIINYGALELFDFISPILDLQPHFANDIIPLALVSVVISSTIGLRVAVYAGFFTAVITSMMFGGSFNMMLNGMLISCLAGFVVRYSLNYKSFFVRIVIVVFLLSLILEEQIYTHFQFSPWTPVYALVNALGTAILALLLLFLLEFIFNVSTNMALLMLCDYNHPLLKRLQLEAPGTFHHSLMVATLAEQAAIAIGASPIKARVGALFHDIGKLIKPEYFSENNAANDKHRELHPRMSSLIILNHVKEGVDMAIKYKLKKIIRDTIERHHGTDIVFYFYKRAMEENNGDMPVAEGEYRYAGPLPREKEVVLVCLADVCEAAARSIQKPTPAKIETLVWELLRKRIRDGQLNEADLTFEELGKVRDSFSKTLTTMFHGRIAYPKDDEEEYEDDLFMASKKIPAAEEEAAEKAD